MIRIKDIKIREDLLEEKVLEKALQKNRLQKEDVKKWYIYKKSNKKANKRLGILKYKKIYYICAHNS